jgi:N-glycosylase/DNA lyase
LEAIDLEGQPLDLDTTLSCGQAFRWRRREDGLWYGVVGSRLVELRVDGDVLYWRTYPDGGRALVEDYLRLSDDVNGIYAELAGCDAHLESLIRRFQGLRLVRQDPTETLLSFICSAANSIPRISTAIEELARQHGELVCETGNLCYYAFPTCERLAAAESGHLDKLGSLGFRGENLRSVARQITERGDAWLMELRDASCDQARAELLSIRGVGPKIADCVCLFSLDKDESVPVDTHVRQLAHRLFLPDMKAKSITDGVYRRIVEAFRERHGRYAGWAQQFLFYEDLLRSREVRSLAPRKSPPT